MAKTKQKIDSVEQLAAYTADEFRSVHGRIDRVERKVDGGFRRMETAFQAVTDTLALIRADLREIKMEMVHDLRKRVERLERHAGLAE